MSLTINNVNTSSNTKDTSFWFPDFCLSYEESRNKHYIMAQYKLSVFKLSKFAYGLHFHCCVSHQCGLKLTQQGLKKFKILNS